MSFPSSPSNGQVTTVNGIQYVYNSTYGSWTRSPLTDLSLGGNLTVSGNLSIAGNTTFINTTVITTTDTIAAPTINAGTIGNAGANITGATLVTTGNVYGGGNIIAASGTTSTSTTTGAIVVSGNGGIGVGGNLFVGANAKIAGNVTINSSTTSSSTSTGALVVAGGIGIGGNISVGGSAGIGTTAPATGLSVVGGATINGGLTLTGSGLTVGSTSLSSAATNPSTQNIASQTGNLTVNIVGGASSGTKTINFGTGSVAGSNTSINIGSASGAGNVIISDNTFVYIGNTQSSTSTNTGALIVAGGVGVGGAVYANLFNASAVYAGTIGNTNALHVGYIQTAYQPNITTIGSLTGLAVSGNANLYSSLNVISNVGAGNFVANTATYSPAYYWANGVSIASTITGTYGNTQVAAYLPTDSTITAIQANVIAANTNISTLFTNAGTQQTQINSLASGANTNVAAYLTTYSGNISGTNFNGSGTATINAFIANGGTTSTSTTTGAIILTGSGGIGVGGNINVGGNVNISTGTVTTNTPALDISQTWNNAATTFTGFRLNVSNTNSSSSSLVFDIQYNGVSQLSLSRGGTLSLTQNMTLGSASILQWSGRGILSSTAAGVIQHGGVNVATPVAQTITAQSVLSGTTDGSGADFKIVGSQNTGAGTNGNIVFQTTSVGNASGTSQNTLQTVMTLGPSIANGSSSTGAVYINQQWNTSGNPTAFLLNVSNTNSGSSSLLADWQFNGTSYLKLNKNAQLTVFAAVIVSGTSGYIALKNGGTLLSSPVAANLQLGNSDAAAPIAQTLGVQNVVAGTSDTSGQPFIVKGSAGTGTGIGGSIAFQVAPATTTGSTQNSFSNVLVLSSNLNATVSGAVNANTFNGVAVYAGTIGNTSANLVGTINTNAQPYITSVGTLSGLTSTGTISAPTINAGTIGNSGANFTGNSVAVTGNISSGNLITGGISTTGAVNINSSDGNYNVLNISGTALAPYGTPQTWKFFTNNTALGGAASFILFPDNSTQTTAYPGTSTSLSLSGTIAASTINAATIGNTGAALTASTATITGTANSYGSGQGALQITGGFYAGGDSYIRGNLVVANITSVGFNQLIVNAPLVYLQADESNYNYEIGFYSQKQDAVVGYNHTGLVRNHIDNVWYLFSNVASEPSNSVDLANAYTILDTLKLGNIIVANTTNSTSNTTGAAIISGGLGVARTLYAGSIQNTPIGNGTASTGAFTTLTTSSTITSQGTVSAPTVNAGTIGNSGANLVGTINTNAQPYITSVGQLTGLTLNGNINTSASVNVVGNIGVGRLVANSGIYSSQYYWANGTVFSSGGGGGSSTVKFTASNTAPISPGLGDTWYQGNTDVLFMYVNDTGSSYWMDITSSPNTFGNLSANVAYIGSTIPLANASYNLGTTSAYWNTVYGVTFVGTSTTAKYADLAENYTSDVPLEPGDVVIFGGNKEITISNKYADTRIAGVVSTNPAYLMNGGLEEGYPIAMTGRVPCKVLGPVFKGQLLVSSNVGGVATGLDESLWKPGCVIGKSMQDIDTYDIEIIEIAVGRY